MRARERSRSLPQPATAQRERLGIQFFGLSLDLSTGKSQDSGVQFRERPTVRSSLRGFWVSEDAFQNGVELVRQGATRSVACQSDSVCLSTCFYLSISLCLYLRGSSFLSVPVCVCSSLSVRSTCLPVCHCLWVCLCLCPSPCLCPCPCLPGGTSVQQPLPVSASACLRLLAFLLRSDLRMLEAQVSDNPASLRPRTLLKFEVLPYVGAQVTL